MDLALVQVYMPHSGLADEEVEESNDMIEDIVEKEMKGACVILMGDWNAVVGEGQDGRTVEKYGLGKRNDRGEYLNFLMDNLEELGRKAYQKQIWGEYMEAVNIYNTAIKKYPKDPRPLNNRCLCYIELKDFKKAMEDADRMIKLFPSHPKSYYRKGEVLAAVKDAEKILRHGTLELYNQNGDGDADDVYYSDDENSCSNFVKQDHNINDPLTDPSNPLKSSSLWVGFITEGVSEKMLKELFSKYGKILSVYVYYSTHCAFINYNDHVAPGKAMKALQGKLIGGRNILIKFPDSAATQTNKRSKAI
ncbi:hypothetical protein ANN_02154 [Periplaneta americana]|uniref:RRM domain-containing protein n=1 Tax=Periplaneta americana TaxID=6978 RepID=A0ABQ8TYY6_PERAM|nr:hypothetical protein ANN_02154 [Periplaneta americana]